MRIGRRIGAARAARPAESTQPVRRAGMVRERHVRRRRSRQTRSARVDALSSATERARVSAGSRVERRATHGKSSTVRNAVESAVHRQSPGCVGLGIPARRAARAGRRTPVVRREVLVDPVPGEVGRALPTARRRAAAAVQGIGGRVADHDAHAARRGRRGRAPRPRRRLRASKRAAAASVAGMSIARLSRCTAPVSTATRAGSTGTRMVRSSSQRDASVKTCIGRPGASAPSALITSTCRLACPNPWPEMQNATATRQPATAGSQARRGSALRRRGVCAERELSTSSRVVTGMKRHVAARLRRQLVEVVFVLRRQNDGLDAMAPRGERLLLDAADRQHQPAQRDLARHRHVSRTAFAGRRRQDGRGHRDARRRPVLGDGARRHVHVEVVLARNSSGEMPSTSACDADVASAARADSCITCRADRSAPADPCRRASAWPR